MRRLGVAFLLLALLLTREDRHLPEGVLSAGNKNGLTYFLHYGFCGLGNLKIKSSADHRRLAQCQNSVLSLDRTNSALQGGFKTGVILPVYVGGYGDSLHVDELLDLCLVPDDYFLILRIDSAPGTTFPLVPIKGIHSEYQEGVDYYFEYSQTVVDYLEKTPCHSKIDAVIVGNEPTFTNPEVVCKEQPKAFEYYLGDPESEQLRKRVESEEFGKELQFCSVGWRNPKITQVITPERYARFFKAIAEALKATRFGYVKVWVAGMELKAQEIYNPYLKAVTAHGAKQYVNGISVHVYSNSLGYTPRCDDQPWCYNREEDLHGETLYFLGKFLAELDPNYKGAPLFIIENNPWIGWGPHPEDLEMDGRVKYIRLFLNTIEYLNSRSYRNKIVAWTPFGWSQEYDDPYGAKFGLSQFPEVYIEGVKRFLTSR